MADAVEVLTFNVDAVTPRMLVDFKRETGVSLMSLVEENGLKMDALSEECIAGVIWLALRMGGRPEATWDEALDTPFTALAPGEAGEKPDPT